MHPLQHLARAVHGGPFFIGGDDQAQLWAGRRGIAGKSAGRGAKGGDGSFHVSRAAPPKKTLPDGTAEGIHGPKSRIAGRDDIGMADEAEMTQSLVPIPFGIKIVNRIAPLLVAAFENEAMTESACVIEERLQAIERVRRGRGQPW